LHNGWSMDYQGLPPVDLLLAAHPDTVVPELLRALVATAKPHPAAAAATRHYRAPAGTPNNEHLARSLRQAVGDRATSLVHLPLSWEIDWWPFQHPLDFLGSDGGGGVGGGPGISVGAALALKGSGRLPIAICGDGDFLMGVTALWTAVHYRIPLLVAIANNRSFYNDEVHQERVAHMRKRPVANKWIGQRMSDPEIDLAGMARAQGATGFGPITTNSELGPAFTQAINVVENGGVAVVDVRVEPGYTASTVSGMTRLKG
jgi:thiamine pyrophosphate-dependent acetolactate synthase large subunit-like protein